MLTLKQLVAWLNDMEKIIFDVSVSIVNLNRMANPENASEKSILQDRFFTHFFHQLRFTLIIQLCKLYVNKDTERRNFRKLFNRLKNEPYDNRLKSRLKGNRDREDLVARKAEITALVKRLLIELESEAEVIHKIKSLRDRIYAHSDPGRNLPEVTDEELERLVGLAVEMYNEVRGKMFDTGFHLDEDRGWKVDHVIEALAFSKKH
ncbi:MAG: hypothetical protein WD052_01185 [Bacteroidales bacterium]